MSQTLHFTIFVFLLIAGIMLVVAPDLVFRIFGAIFLLIWCGEIYTKVFVKPTKTIEEI